MERSIWNGEEVESMRMPEYQMSAKEKVELERRFHDGSLKTSELREIKFKTGYGICHHCGRTVKYANIMMYKRMVKHKCRHGKDCRAGGYANSGNNHPQPFHCRPCYDEWVVWDSKRKESEGYGR